MTRRRSSPGNAAAEVAVSSTEIRTRCGRSRSTRRMPMLLPSRSSPRTRAALDGGDATVPYWPRFAIGCDATRAPDYSANAEMVISSLPRWTARLCAVALLLVSGGSPTLAAKPVPGWQAVLVAADNAEPVFDNAVETIARQLA